MYERHQRRRRRRNTTRKERWIRINLSRFIGHRRSGFRIFISCARCHNNRALISRFHFLLTCSSRNSSLATLDRRCYLTAIVARLVARQRTTIQCVSFLHQTLSHTLNDSLLAPTLHPNSQLKLKPISASPTFKVCKPTLNYGLRRVSINWRAKKMFQCSVLSNLVQLSYCWIFMAYVSIP